MKNKSSVRSDIKNLKALGVSANRNKDLYQFDKPNKKLLEGFKNVYPKNDSLITFHSSEGLQSLCPLTGQPDSCRNLWIQYIPDKLILESKSLKLYMNGFRNHGCFHEEICHIIANDIFEIIKPKWIKIVAEYEPRGGYAIIPMVEKSKPNFKTKLIPPSIPLSKN